MKFSELDWYQNFLEIASSVKQFPSISLLGKNAKWIESCPRIEMLE